MYIVTVTLSLPLLKRIVNCHGDFGCYWNKPCLSSGEEKINSYTTNEAVERKGKKGPDWELNPGPLPNRTPKGRIMLLDHQALCFSTVCFVYILFVRRKFILPFNNSNISFKLTLSLPGTVGGHCPCYASASSLIRSHGFEIHSVQGIYLTYLRLPLFYITNRDNKDSSSLRHSS